MGRMTDPVILQFGTSRFLQAHVDFFAHEAAVADQSIPGIVIVQTTRDAARAERLRGFADPAGFEVQVRGLENGVPVERSVQVRSVIDGMSVGSDWDAIRSLMSDRVSHVVSNTGDTGYVVAAEDRSPAILTGAAPTSFPAILLALLHGRWRAGGAGVTLMPCELVRTNGDRLREVLLELAQAVGAEVAFMQWLKAECIWVNTLVDRIVSGALEPAGAIAEPYALWAVEKRPGLDMPFRHPDVVLTDDLDRYERLKVHILNLGHSWLAERWLASGADEAVTVRAMLDDAETLAALRDLYRDEVVPGFAAHGLGDEATAYVERTIERFRNPFLDHRVADIHVGHSAKIAKRVAAFVKWVDGTESPALDMPVLRALVAQYEESE